MPLHEQVDRVVAPRALGRLRCQVDAEAEAVGQPQDCEPADLSTRAAEDTLGHALEQSGPDGEVHELVGRYHRAVRSHPSGQQFGAHDHAGAGVDLGLEERHDLAVVDRPPQAKLEVDSLVVLPSQFGVEVGDPAATRRLRPVERDVRVRQHLADVERRASVRGRRRC